MKRLEIPIKHLIKGALLTGLSFFAINSMAGEHFEGPGSAWETTTNWQGSSLPTSWASISGGLTADLSSSQTITQSLRLGRTFGGSGGAGSGTLNILGTGHLMTDGVDVGSANSGGHVGTLSVAAGGQLTGTGTFSSISVGNAAGTSDTDAYGLVNNSGTINVNSGIPVRNGIFNQSGTLSTTQFGIEIGQDANAGTSEFNQLAGTTSGFGWVQLGQSGGDSGDLNVSGGSMDVSGFMVLRENSNVDVSGTGNLVLSGFARAEDTSDIDVSGGSMRVQSLDLDDSSTATVSGGALTIGTFDLDVNDSATLTISSGSLTVARHLDADNGGTFTFTGGDLTVLGDARIDDVADKVFTVGSGDSLRLGGNFRNHIFADGLVIANGGVFEILGTTLENQDGNIAGDMTLNDGAIFEYSLNPSATAADKTDVGGNLTLGDITIDLSLYGSGPSYLTDENVLFEFDDLFALGFGDIFTPGDDAANTLALNANVSPTFVYGSKNLQLLAANNPTLAVVGNTVVLTGFSAFAIPEPSSLVLFAIGGALLRRRRMRIQG